MASEQGTISVIRAYAVCRWCDSSEQAAEFSFETDAYQRVAMGYRLGCYAFVGHRVKCQGTLGVAEGSVASPLRPRFLHEGFQAAVLIGTFLA